MKIHFTVEPDFGPENIAYNALRACHNAGTVAPHVGFKMLIIHRGGLGFAYSLEIQLEADERDRGRRAGNSGSYGPMQDGSYTATYDEWGFFLAALFRMDPGARVAPNFKRDTAIYYDAVDFHIKTGCTYKADYPDHVEEYGDTYPYRYGRDQIGRRGAGRLSEDESTQRLRYAKHAPRTAEFLRQLHRGETF